jgi:hypothetical protein
VPSKYFTDEEMKCKCGKCGGLVFVNPELWRVMDYVRAEVGHALVPTSGYRCAQHPDEKEKPTPGEHNYGCAVDLPYTSGGDLWKILHAAKTIGVKRLGIGKGFIHLGVSLILPNNVIWTYYAE